MTPLHYVCALGYLDRVKQFIDRYIERLTTRQILLCETVIPKGASALTVAILFNQPDVIRLVNKYISQRYNEFTESKLFKQVMYRGVLVSAYELAILHNIAITELYLNKYLLNYCKNGNVVLYAVQNKGYHALKAYSDYLSLHDDPICNEIISFVDEASKSVKSSRFDGMAAPEFEELVELVNDIRNGTIARITRTQHTIVQLAEEEEEQFLESNGGPAADTHAGGQISERGLTNENSTIREDNGTFDCSSTASAAHQDMSALQHTAKGMAKDCPCKDDDDLQFIQLQEQPRLRIKRMRSVANFEELDRDMRYIEETVTQSHVPSNSSSHNISGVRNILDDIDETGFGKLRSEGSLPTEESERIKSFSLEEVRPRAPPLMIKRSKAPTGSAAKQGAENEDEEW